MTAPIYIKDGGNIAHVYLELLMNEVNWLNVRDARAEAFMAVDPTTYTYGTPPHAVAYESVPFHERVEVMRRMLNNVSGFAMNKYSYNVCFLNRYDTQKHQLGWHSDDSPGMRHDHPIAVVSFGAEREIWWRPIGQTGVIPTSQRQLLGNASLFIMPPGFQMTHQHRIPKCDRECGPRVSLTFRRYVPEIA